MGLIRIAAMSATGGALFAGSTVAAEGGMPQLDFSSWGSQIFWLAISLVTLFLVFRNIALPRIAAGLEERSEKIESDLDRAATFRREAEAAEAAYDRALAEARSKAQEIAQAARDSVQAEVEAAVAKADAEIAARAAEGEKRIAEIAGSALQAVEDVALETVGVVIESVAPGMGDDKTARAAVSAIVRR